MTELISYISELVQLKALKLALPTLKFDRNFENPKIARSDSQHEFRVSFNEITFGVLKCDSKLEARDLDELKDFAVQLACLFQTGSPTEAIKLDQYVESLSQKNLNRFHWTGIYLLKPSGLLEVAAFRGERTPHLVIPIDSGICGAAVREKTTLNIADVSKDSRYLSCSIKTKSEIVVPIFSVGGKEVIGEIDIDSHLPGAFTVADEKSLARDAVEIAKILSR